MPLNTLSEVQMATTIQPMLRAFASSGINLGVWCTYSRLLSE
jgi:hypothetical protein